MFARLPNTPGVGDIARPMNRSPARPLFARALLVVLTLVPSAALAQTGPALLLKPLLSEDEHWESRGDVLVIPNTDADGAEFDMTVFELSGRFRENREKFIPRIGWDLTWFNLSSEVDVLDQDLIDTSVAVGLELGEYFGDWRAGLTVGVGYAGNAPFGEASAWYGKATLIAGRKLSEKTDFALVVDYDGNRTVFPDVPLPGFAYRHEYDPTLVYTIGIPISSVTWRPDKPVMIEVSWQIVDRFDARVEYKLSSQWTVFGNLEQRSEGFSVDEVEGNDRLLFEQRRAELGVRWQPWEHTSLLVAGGYAFGSEFSIGFDQRDSDKLAEVSDEPYVRFGFERRF